MASSSFFLLVLKMGVLRIHKLTLIKAKQMITRSWCAIFTSRVLSPSVNFHFQSENFDLTAALVETEEKRSFLLSPVALKMTHATASL